MPYRVCYSLERSHDLDIGEYKKVAKGGPSPPVQREICNFTPFPFELGKLLFCLSEDEKGNKTMASSRSVVLFRNVHTKKVKAHHAGSGTEQFTFLFQQQQQS